MSDDWEAHVRVVSEDGSNVNLRLDEFKDVLVSLNLLKNCLAKICDDISFWKWAIVAAHNSLQGACVCLLTQTDGSGALAKNHTKELMRKLYGKTDSGPNLENEKIEWPDEFIAPLPELLARLPGDLAVSLPKRKSSPYPFDMAGDLRRLNDYRNDFIHFPPSTSLLMPLSGLPRIILNSVVLTEQIINSENYPRRNKFICLPTGKILREIKDSLEALQKDT